jgi:flavin reductase (DIM6/NTAB) family NADH-FMN oxidoreductase RutF
MFIDAREFEDQWRDLYKLAISIVIPRPIGFISSISTDGIRNLAPYSFYQIVSSRPPVVMFAPVTKRDSSVKDSLTNARDTGEFVVASVSEAIAQPMNHCSVDYAADVDEFDISKLTPAPAHFVNPPLVAESPINLECKTLEIKHFGDGGPGSGNVVFGQVLALHIDDSVLAEDGLVDPMKLKAIGRMGRMTYSRTTDAFELPRPQGP